MYGKAFASMYTGSMMGKGAHVFAVWGWLIANSNEDGTVEANPPLVAFQIGQMSGTDVEQVIDFLLSEDPKSRSKEDSGRRLERLGEFMYRIVNRSKYAKMHSEYDRRSYEAGRKALYRQGKKGTVPNVRDKSGTVRDKSRMSRKVKAKEEVEVKIPSSDLAPSVPIPSQAIQSGGDARGGLTSPAPAGVPKVDEPFSLERPEPPAGRQSKAGPTKLPAGYPFSPEHQKIAAGIMPNDCDSTKLFDQFTAFWYSNGKMKHDWIATWRVWCHNAVDRGYPRKSTPNAPESSRRPLFGGVEVLVPNHTDKPRGR